MRGSLREKRDGYWEVRIEAGVDRLTGKRVQVSRSVSGSRRDAEKVLNTLISKHETASVGGSTTATFGGLLTTWLDHAEGRPRVSNRRWLQAVDQHGLARSSFASWMLQLSIRSIARLPKRGLRQRRCGRRMQ